MFSTASVEGCLSDPGNREIGAGLHCFLSGQEVPGYCNSYPPLFTIGSKQQGIVGIVLEEYIAAVPAVASMSSYPVLL